MEEDIKKQNLSKIAIKNSGYAFLYNLVLKFGGLIFTMIIARTLLPELFGAYSLVLSIITIFVVLTNLGLDDTLLRYLSLAIGKKKISQARSHFKLLFKIKLLAVFIVVILVIILSKFFSYSLYKNPLLFYPLIFACLYLITESFWSFFSNFFIALKDLKTLVILNCFIQILKISLALFALAILSDAFKVSGLFVVFFLSEAIVLFIAILILVKKDKNFFFGPKYSITQKKVLSFLGFMGIINVSLVLFTSVDTLILGKFVSLEYLGYYRAAASLAFTISSLASFSGLFLPIFTQINGKRFNRGFHKTLRYLLMISLPATAGIIFISKYLIKAIYGNEYIFGAIPLYFLSFLIITVPLINLYSMIFEAKGKPKIVGKSIVISLLLGIVLDLLVIFLFKNNPLFIISGIGLITSLNRFILLGLLIFYAKKEFNFRIKGIGLRAPIFATIVMSAFLLVFNHFVNINIFLGIIEIILGVLIYFGVLFLVKGITKDDLILIKSLI